MAKGSGTTRTVGGNAAATPRSNGGAAGMTFANEKKLQEVFNLRHQPDRYITKGSAFNSLQYYVKPMRVMEVDENPYGIASGWYVVSPVDAERLLRKAKGLITYAKR